MTSINRQVASPYLDTAARVSDKEPNLKKITLGKINPHVFFYAGQKVFKYNHGGNHIELTFKPFARQVELIFSVTRDLDNQDPGKGVILQLKPVNDKSKIPIELGFETEHFPNSQAGSASCPTNILRHGADLATDYEVNLYVRDLSAERTDPSGKETSLKIDAEKTETRRDDGEVQALCRPAA